MEVEKVTLAEALEATGLKKYVIAKRLGFNPTHYSRFIKSVKNIRPEQIVAILEMTGLNYDQIKWNK